jgi:hypothetical protein
VANVNLVPMKGRLKAMVFDNPHLGILPTLFFSIVIPVRPFVYRGRMQKTEAVLEFINFGVESWTELPQREFAFPVNPEDGFIDGSLYLSAGGCGGHNPADTTGIRFGPLTRKNILPASLDIQFDFTQEGFGDLGTIDVTWNADLKIAPRELDAVCSEARRRRATRKNK